MVRIGRLLCVASILVLPFAAMGAQDKEGCKDHPLFTRMPNFEIYSCATAQFDAVDFAKPGRDQYAGPDDYDSIEGSVFSISYALKEGATPATSLQIIRNFQNAAKAAGGSVIGEYAEPFTATLTSNTARFLVDSPGGVYYDRYTNLSFKKGNSEYWVVVAASAEYNDYSLVVVERQAMAQEVSVTELVDKLNKEGFITLHINFDTNKAVIKPESNATLNDAAAALKAASTLSIVVAGHTDNVGTPEANMKLSDERAKAVMAALVQRGIPADRLTAEGFGQTQPIADNRTEEGRARNRRVELTRKQ